VGGEGGGDNRPTPVLTQRKSPFFLSLLDAFLKDICLDGRKQVGDTKEHSNEEGLVHSGPCKLTQGYDNQLRYVSYVGILHNNTITSSRFN